MRTVIFYCACVLSFFLCTVLPSQAAEWRFPIGISYISGLNDVNDLHNDNLEVEGYTVSSQNFVWPVGITFQPYYQFDNNYGLGFGFGPCMFSLGGKSSFSSIPVGVDLRYTLNPSSNTSPYARGGIRYNLASGDYVKGSSPNFFVALGMEFRKLRNLGWGFEIFYDASEIEFEKYHLISSDDSGAYDISTMKLKPYSLTLSIFLNF